MWYRNRYTFRHISLLSSTTQVRANDQNSGFFRECKHTTVNFLSLSERECRPNKFSSRTVHPHSTNCTIEKTREAAMKLLLPNRLPCNEFFVSSNNGTNRSTKTLQNNCMAIENKSNTTFFCPLSGLH